MASNVKIASLQAGGRLIDPHGSILVDKALLGY